MKTIKAHIDRSLKDIFSPSELEYVRRALCMEYLGISGISYYTGADVGICPGMMHRLDDALGRLSSGEPLQYVLGSAPMCDLTFRVDRRVLIPRPETSELVEWIASDLKGMKAGRLLDIGTGSGCIAVTLSHLFPDWKTEGWDISEDALDLAECNNRLNGTEVTFRMVDILDGMEWKECGVFDVIVSNPPYIAESERAGMERTVLDYEPHAALFVPDDDPLLFYRVIAGTGREHLSPGGALYLEINPLYADEMVPMLKYRGYGNIEMRNDISGRPRFVRCIS
ncbi:MAG: peptide chain release factor N(5)-glutamine methyltransferase [Bacteroidaceae bacterium]|nr:peptide chain release factor N(5)-glutamine methyltransferase [Bacteroidaceae bacterium]